MSHFCRIHSVENSFLSALGPELDFLAWGSYAVELAHCAPPPSAEKVTLSSVFFFNPSLSLPYQPEHEGYCPPCSASSRLLCSLHHAEGSAHLGHLLLLLTLGKPAKSLQTL